jgi:hypothetical protein
VTRPAATAALVVGVLVVVTFGLCLAKAGGAFVYPLDDAYIHLALAKNLVAGAGYGVTAYEFTPTSSSIVWPLLLAVLRYATRSDLVPLILNVLAAFGLTLVVERNLADVGYLGRTRAWVTVAVLLGVPILPVVFIGMEHTAHIAVMILLATYAVRWLASEAPPGPRALAASFGLAMAAALLRYETVFVLVVLGVLALRRRRLSLAVALGAGAGLPVLCAGLWARSHGAPFFPISLLLKRTEFDALASPALFFYRLLENPHVLVLLALLALFYVLLGSVGFWDRRRLLLLVTGVGMLLHVLFAQLLWFYRYEAYAVALSLVAIAGAARGHLPQIRAFWAPGAIITLPLTMRALSALVAVPQASANIHDQQMQVALFIADFFPQSRVVVNDIGAVAYVSDAHLVDLMGLGSMDVFRARMKHRGRGLDREDVQALTRDADVAIVYDDWFEGTLPPSWKRLGRWRIANNKVCAKDIVSIYAANPAVEPVLLAALRDFSPHLPKSVEQSGLYLPTKAD